MPRNALRNQILLTYDLFTVIWDKQDRKDSERVTMLFLWIDPSHVLVISSGYRIWPWLFVGGSQNPKTPQSQVFFFFSLVTKSWKCPWPVSNFILARGQRCQKRSRVVPYFCSLRDSSFLGNHTLDMTGEEIGPISSCLHPIKPY